MLLMRTHHERLYRWSSQPCLRMISALAVMVSCEAVAVPATDCVPLADAVERLACYDRAFGRVDDGAGARASAAPLLEPAGPATSAAARPSLAATAAGASGAIEPRAAISASSAGAVTAADRFGKASIPATAPADSKNEPERIQARVVGRVDGPARGQQLLLDNGQRWVNIDDRDFSAADDNPQVTLWRNLIGSYWLRIEPRGPQIRVRRVQ